MVFRSPCSPKGILPHDLTMPIPKSQPECRPSRTLVPKSARRPATASPLGIEKMGRAVIAAAGAAALGVTVCGSPVWPGTDVQSVSNWQERWPGTSPEAHRSTAQRLSPTRGMSDTQGDWNSTTVSNTTGYSTWPATSYETTTPSHETVQPTGVPSATRTSTITIATQTVTIPTVLLTTYAPPASKLGPKFPSINSTVPENACASIRSLAMKASAASPEAVPTVPAALAYECINSVPFHHSAAVDLLDSIRPYLEWQTNLQWIKDPPLEYAQKIQAPYDFMKNFEGIYTKASAGSYASEYEFGFELYRCFQRAHNGHFTLMPDSVGNIFAFGRPTPLVSVSMDGTGIPEVFVYTDIVETIKGNASFVPSPITLIDGQNSTEYLLHWSQYGVLQDPDALWNNVFYLLGAVSLGAAGTGTGTFAGGGHGRSFYPGESTTLTFANGSAVTHPNFARVLVSFDNITSGVDIYEQYLTPPPGKIMPAEELATQTTTFPATTMTLSTPSATVTTTTTTVLAPGFPVPFIREVNNTNSGYFLEGEGYDDVAVLSIQNFVGPQSDEIPFQAVNTYFIEQAVARNKTKLIIDLSANGGGTILQGYDLFKQLFPHLLPYGANRFRAHEALDYIGQEYSAFSGRFERSMKLHGKTGEYVSSFYNYRSDVNVNYTNFASWSEKFGPETFGPGPDNYTSLQRWNLTDVLTPISSGGIYVSGYLKRSNVTTQPFATENVVIVSDGYCASTCAIFSELMRQQAGVKIIFLGGRPNTDITQAIGGVKGTNMRSYGTILESVQVPFTYESVHSREFYKRTALGAYNNLAVHRTMGSVNSREGFRQNDTSNIPLQFLYEPADCRIYYTPEMAVDMTAAWKTVADSAFHGINHCIAGGFSGGEESSREKRSVDMSRRKKHGVREDLDVEVHKETIMNVWTGKDGFAFEGSGDAYMLP